MKKTLAQWRADDHSYYKEAQTPFELNDRNGHIKPAELTRLFMEIAGDDFGERGLSHSYMLERGYYFILTRSKLHILADVPDETHVLLRTWPYKARSMQVFRAYEMRDADGKLLACGSSVFMIIGPDGKPIRMKDFPFLDWADVVCEDVPADQFKGRIRPHGDVVRLGTVHARFNDLDRNGHVNNARYFAYAQDALPEIMRNRWIADCSIEYDLETKVDQDLHVCTDATAMADGRLQLDDDGWVTLYGRNADDEPSFGCRFKFADAQ
jgi:medium-chain acyl-[acyl-carrier-protein] hydrolase